MNSSRLIERIVIGVVLSAIIIPAIWGVATGREETVEVSVVWQADPSQSDRVTHLGLHVRNLGEATIEPVFFVPGGALMNWQVYEILEGPRLLGPGEDANYTVMSPAYTAVPFGRDFAVVVHDAGGDPVGDSGRIQFDVPIEPVGDTGTVPFVVDPGRPSALNPSFQWWEYQMFTEFPMPYAWVPLDRTNAGHTWTINGTDGALDVRLFPSSDQVENSTVIVRQNIDFPSHLRIAYDEDSLVVGHDATVAIILEDVYGERRIDFLLRPSREFVPPWEYGEDESGEFVRIEINQPDTTLDMVDIWETLGWDIPAKRNIERLSTVNPGNIGFGAAAGLAANQQIEIMRPMELEILAVSRWPHTTNAVGVTMEYLGGPALDPAPSRG